MSDEEKRFTIVFAGDIRKLDISFATESVFGKIVAMGDGNAIEELDKVENENFNAAVEKNFEF